MICKRSTLRVLAVCFLIYLGLGCDVSDSRSGGGGADISNPPIIQSEDANPDVNSEDTPLQGGDAIDGAPDPIVVVSFDEVVKPLITNACANCHQPDGAAPFLVLETYDQVKGSLAAMLKSLDNSNDPMPPGSSAAQRADIKKVLLDWQEAGYPKSAQ